MPAVLVPSQPDKPDFAYEKLETRQRVLAAIQSLPHRERKVIGLYYYGDATMKQIGAEIGVNESRVSQLHAKAIRRLRALLDQNGSVPLTSMMPKPRNPTSSAWLPQRDLAPALVVAPAASMPILRANGKLHP